MLNLGARYFCAKSVCIILLGRERGAYLSTRTAGVECRKNLYKACTPQHFHIGYLKFFYSNFWYCKPTVLRKCQTVMDNKVLSLHNNMKEPPVATTMALIYYKPNERLTATCGCLRYPTASQAVLDTYIPTPRLLKLKLIVSITNIWPGFVLPQGY